METLAPGDRVNYRHYTSKGYGTTTLLAAVILHQSEFRVRIAMYNLRTGRIVEKSVTHSRLTPRTSHSILDDKLAEKEAQPT